MYRSLVSLFHSIRKVLQGPVEAVIIALAVCSLFFLAAGVNPFKAYWVMLEGSFGSIYSLSVTGLRMTPIILTGLSATLAIKAKVFNIGMEGQLYMGAVGATVVGLLPGTIPAFLHISLALIVGSVCGLAWSLIPALLRAYRGINEIIVTLMFNYIAIHLTSYLINGKNGILAELGADFPMSPRIAESCRLPELIPNTGLHFGFLIAIVMAVLVYVTLSHTTVGFRFRMMGASEEASHFSGINIPRQICYVMMLGGLLSGLAGAIEIVGLKFRLYDHFSPGYGYDGIAVSLLAKLHPLGTILSAAFFGALRAGGTLMQQVTGVQVSIIYIILCLTIIFVAGRVSLRPLFMFRRRVSSPISKSTPKMEGGANA